MAKRRKKYPMEFKLEAVRLITEQNLSFAEVGDDLGVNRTTIRDWVRRDEAGILTGGKARPKSLADLEAENKRLRRKNAILEEEREILKKAAAFFVKESR
jgi:transposase